LLRPRAPPTSPPFPYTTLFRSFDPTPADGSPLVDNGMAVGPDHDYFGLPRPAGGAPDIGAVERGGTAGGGDPTDPVDPPTDPVRSEEHTSELQSRENLVCRLLL